MIFTHADVLVCVVNCTSLAYDDVTSFYNLTTEFLESETFAL